MQTRYSAPGTAGRLRAWAALGALLLAGCSYVAVHTAPKKQPLVSSSAQAVQAKQAFWRAFHEERYEALPEVTEQLTAAYLANPRDPQLALLTAHAHLWRGAEYKRMPRPVASVTDQFALANYYFVQAYELSPDDGRIPGWLGSTQAALGAIHADERERRQGYYTLKDSVGTYPEFNHFTIGYVLSRLPAGDPRLNEALGHLWDALDLCVGRKVDRRNPQIPDFFAQQTSSGPRRVCFNSALAPHNVEGFFLVLGDVLVKTGDPQTARQAYALTKLAPSYQQWRYKAVLEERVETADQRAGLYANERDPAKQPVTVSNSDYACTVCHAGSGERAAFAADAAGTARP